ncbi:hypothetical protein RRG08_043068 [Elysia crispata]|uniref:Uncharacterized protein n=1 Tax=Elysia crispata TaxID=231223 RepID=A0AAE0XYK3_9GAST|nr:hypothetical protein RRG08_043068 [Elysia crispata]
MKSGATSDQQTYNQLRLHLYFDPAMQHTNMDQEYSLVLTWAASSGTAATAETGRTGTRAVYSTWPTCCPHRAWAGRGGGGAGGGAGDGADGAGGDALAGRAVPAAARPSSRPGQQLGGTRGPPVLHPGYHDDSMAGRFPVEGKGPFPACCFQ